MKAYYNKLKQTRPELAKAMLELHISINKFTTLVESI